MGLTSWLTQRSSSTAPSSTGSYRGRRGLNTPFPALQAAGSLCQSPRWTAHPLSAPARTLQPQRRRALTRRLCTHRLWSVLWSQASNFGTMDFRGHGQITLSGGLSWVPWGMEPHLCPQPFNVRSLPSRNHHRCPQTSPVSQTKISRIIRYSKSAGFFKNKSLDLQVSSESQTDWKIDWLLILIPLSNTERKVPTANTTMGLPKGRSPWYTKPAPASSSSKHEWQETSCRNTGPSVSFYADLLLKPCEASRSPVPSPRQMPPARAQTLRPAWATVLAASWPAQSRETLPPTTAKQVSFEPSTVRGPGLWVLERQGLHP